LLFTSFKKKKTKAYSKLLEHDKYIVKGKNFLKYMYKSVN